MPLINCIKDDVLLFCVAASFLITKLPKVVNVCPDGTVIPAFPVINPEALITAAVKVPALVNI